MLRRLLKYRLVRWLLILLLTPYPLTLAYWVVPPPSTLMLADLATLTMPQRSWVSLGDISPSLVNAVLAAEDSAFCQHFGFDFEQVGRSLEKAKRGKRLRGASTITQQTAKNLFLWKGRSWLRKFLEAPLTLWLELVLSKRRILEIYLNIAQWGPGIYGAESAAQHHFGVDASRLSVRQAALLATSLPDPMRRRAKNPGPGQAAMTFALERRMQAHGPDLSCLK